MKSFLIEVAIEERQHAQSASLRVIPVRVMVRVIVRARVTVTVGVVVRVRVRGVLFVGSTSRDDLRGDGIVGELAANSQIEFDPFLPQGFFNGLLEEGLHQYLCEPVHAPDDDADFSALDLCLAHLHVLALQFINEFVHDFSIYNSLPATW